MEIIKESIERVTHDGKVLAERVVNGKAGAKLRLHGPSETITLDAKEWDAWLATVRAAETLMETPRIATPTPAKPRKGRSDQVPLQARPYKRAIKRPLAKTAKAMLTELAVLDTWVRPDDVKDVVAHIKSSIQAANNTLYTLVSLGYAEMRGHRWRWEYKVTEKGKAVLAALERVG